MMDVERKRTLVVAALIRRAGTVLVSQRRPDQPMPLLWEFPGGKVESGESPAEALTREIREELGCEIQVGRIEEVVFHAYPSFDLYMLVYNCTLTPLGPAGEIAPEGTIEPEVRPVEVERVAWVPVTELPSLALLPADYPLARRLADEASSAVP
jgi:8-oxo-dGTP diphosphatase